MGASHHGGAPQADVDHAGQQAAQQAPGTVLGQKLPRSRRKGRLGCACHTLCHLQQQTLQRCTPWHMVCCPEASLLPNEACSRHEQLSPGLHPKQTERKKVCRPNLVLASCDGSFFTSMHMHGRQTCRRGVQAPAGAS